MAVSLQQAFTQLLALKKDLSDVPQATFIYWCDYINKFLYRALLATDSDRYVKTASIQVLSGQSNYLISSIASDFKNITSFNEGIYYSNNQTGLPLDRKLVITGYGSQVQGYYLDRLNFVFTPQPVQNVLYYLRYNPQIITLSLINEYFSLDGLVTGTEIIPDEFIQYVVSALDAQYAVWDEDIGSESYADSRFVRALNELLSYIKRSSPVYGLTDFSLTF